MLNLSQARSAAAIAVLTVVLALATLAAAVSAGAAPRGVALSDATMTPHFTAVLTPGQRVTVENQCLHGGYFTEFSAYNRDGSALGPQHRTRHDVQYWRARHGYVGFDGVTFRNNTYRTVIVAGWCS